MLPKDFLIKLGFSDKESIVYIKLLELKAATPNEIANEINFPRPTVYDLINKMHKKGFVTEIERNGKKYFTPVNPTIIFEKAKNEISSLKSALPLLLNLTKQTLKQPRIRFFEGLESFKEIFEDTLSEKNYTLYSFVDPSKVPENFLPFLARYLKKRIKNNIFAKVICPFSLKAKWYKSLDEGGLKETRYLNKPWFELFTEFQIYNNKISITDYGVNKIGLIIEDMDIAYSMKNIFIALWESLEILRD